MRLLYLFIKSFGCLRDAELSFSADYSWMLKLTRDKQLLQIKYAPQMFRTFFSLSRNGQNTGVDLVSAIVGRNGCGKTSVSRFLHRLFSGKDVPCDYICAFECEKDIVVKYRLASPSGENGGLKLGVKLSPCRCKKVFLIGSGRRKPDPRHNGFELHHPVMCYLSPCFTTEHQLSTIEPYFYDYSTSALLREAEQVAENEGGSPIDIHNQAEKIRVIMAAKDCSADQNVEDPLHFETLKGTGVSLKWNRSAADEYIESLEQDDGLDSDDIRKDIGSLAYWLTRNRRKRNYALNAFCVYVTLYLKTYREKWSDREGKLVGDEAVVESLREVVRAVNAIACPGQKHDTMMQGLKGICDRLGEKASKIQNFYNALLLLDTLHGDRIVRFDFDELWVKFTDEGGQYEKILKIVDILGDSSPVDPVHKVDLFPRVSSGELSFLSVWGRLRQFFARIGALKSQLNEDNAVRNVVLFFDEAETTLHPQWQCDLVYNVIWYIENFTRNVRAHLIFATHSPMLLSDVPIGNCVFLRNQGGVSRSVDLLDDAKGLNFTNTFAANIFDMYYLPFFIREHGPIGAFADRKIAEVIKRLEKRGHRAAQDRQDRKVIELIGDPFLRGYLNDALAEMGNPGL